MSAILNRLYLIIRQHKERIKLLMQELEEEKKSLQQVETQLWFHLMSDVGQLQPLDSDSEETWQGKSRELLELKKRKLELELEQTKKHLEEQERQLNDADMVMPGPATSAIRPPHIDPAADQRPPPPIGVMPATSALLNPLFEEKHKCDKNTMFN